MIMIEHPAMPKPNTKPRKVSLLLILTGTAPDLTPDLELCPLDCLGAAHVKSLRVIFAHSSGLLHAGRRSDASQVAY